MARSKTQSSSSAPATTTSASASTDSVTPVVAAPAAAPAVAATPKAPRAASSKKSKTLATVGQTSPAAPAAVAVSAPSATTVVAGLATVVDVTAEAVADLDSTLSLTADFTLFQSKLQQAASLLSSIRSDFRVLERKASRELRAANKVTNKRKRKAVNRNPSGFVKPTLISNELAAFLGKDQGTEMARTEVTREINAYIRQHNLQDTSNGRKINADDKLSGLLKLQQGDELTYFNLQKYMSPHFTKTAAAVASA
jgi:hypothetical protein